MSASNFSVFVVARECILNPVLRYGYSIKPIKAYYKKDGYPFLCVSFCNQHKAHFGLPWVAPGTIAVNVTWMKRGFNACQTHRSMYPSIFKRFPVIQPVSSNVRHFSTFFAHFGLHVYAPGTIAVNITWMERGFNSGQTHCSIYPYIFNRLRVIAKYWTETATFSYPLAFNAPVGGVPIGIPGKSLVLKN